MLHCLFSTAGCLSCATLHRLLTSMSTPKDFKLSTVPYFNSQQRSLYPYLIFIREKYLFFIT